MIINTDKKEKIGIQKWYPYFIGIGLLLVVFFLLKKSNDLGGNTLTYFTNLDQKLGNEFVGSGANFSNGDSQSDEKSFSGKYAARLDINNVYGPGVDFENVIEGDVFEASCWRQSDEGYGVLAFQGSTGFYSQASEVVKRENGWELIKRSITIPIGTKKGTLKIYPYNTLKTGVVFFDDIKIVRTKAKKIINPNASFDAKELNFKISENDMEKLRKKRLEAFHYGNLLASKKDLVKSKLVIDGKEELDVQIRLKGDLLDHLQGQKWSFRVVPESGTSFLGMTEFSIHNSASRNHLGEWIFHKMLEENDIITTKYDFAKVSVNDKTIGIYAYDQHFDNALMETYKRKPSNIIRISEEGHWLYAPKNLSPRPPWFDSAQIEPFDKQKIKDEKGYQNYATAQSLLYDFIQGNKKAAEVFDVDRLAKFMAIQDVCIAYHAFNYTNLRFYFNESTGLLEPIGYDGYPGEGTQGNTGEFTGASINSRAIPQEMYPDKMLQFHGNLFNDYEFSKRYLKVLNELTGQEYIDAFVTKYKNDIDVRAAFIKQDYPNYDFKIKDFLKNADMAQKTMFPQPEISIKAYKSGDKLIVENYHIFPIEIVGLGNKDINQKIGQTLEAYNKQFPVRRYDIPYTGKSKNIIVRTLGTTNTVSFPIFKWEAPMKIVQSNQSNVSSFNFLSIAGKEVIMQRGVHDISKDLIIPKGYKLRIPTGSKVTLTNGASIISNAAIQAVGTENQPIIIESKTGQGIIINGTNEKSIFKHVNFIDLGNIQNGRQFTDGSLTINESDIDIDRCQFMNSEGKQAINLINTNYNIQNTVFQDAKGSAINAIYSKGKINNCIFQRVGIIGVEIIGGHSNMEDIDISKCLDKGLVTSQHAQVKIGQLKISDTNIGVISKDDAQVEIYKLTLSNVKQGLAAYHELGAYKGGHIVVKKKDFKNVDQEHSIENGSKLILVNEIITTN